MPTKKKFGVDILPNYWLMVVAPLAELQKEADVGRVVVALFAYWQLLATKRSLTSAALRVLPSEHRLLRVGPPVHLDAVGLR